MHSSYCRLVSRPAGSHALLTTSLNSHDTTEALPPCLHVIACALAAKADLIVSGDKDLLDLNAFRDIPILAPAEALRRVQAQT